MRQKNCWDFKKCGRELGGDNVEKLGVCSAALPSNFSGTNKGQHGGRFCWAIRGTICDVSENETFESKIKTCLNCKFLQDVQEEEGKDFTLIPQSSDFRKK